MKFLTILLQESKIVKKKFCPLKCDVPNGGAMSGNGVDFQALLNASPTGFVACSSAAWYDGIDQSEVVEVIINEKYLR